MKKIIILMLAVITSVTSIYGTKTPLIEAASKGDLKEVKRLVKKTKRNGKKKDINKEVGNHTSLTAAVEGGHTKVVKYLLKNGANANIQTEKYVYTPLHFLVRGIAEEKVKDLKIAAYLVKYGADLKAKDYKKRTPVAYANEMVQRYKEVASGEGKVKKLEKLIGYLELRQAEQDKPKEKEKMVKYLEEKKGRTKEEIFEAVIKLIMFFKK